MPKRRRICAVQVVVVVEPLRCQKRADELSVRERIVLSLISKFCAAASRCKSPPASSRSFIVMDPVGLDSVTSCCLMSSGHSSLQRMECCCLCGERMLAVAAGRSTPPAPCLQAS